jgi:PAS domain S-box-containing protein
VFRFCPDAILVQDADSREFLDVNEGFEKIFGYPRAEVIGRTPLGLGLWARLEEQVGVSEALMKGEALRDTPVFGRCKDGTVRVLLLSGKQISVRDRKCIVAVIRDLTDRLQEEQALRESEERFSKIFRSSPDGLAIVDLETGRLLEANPTYEQLFGYSREELIGRTTLELQIYQDPDDRTRLVDRLRATGSIRGHEIPCKNRKGDPVIIEFSGEVIEMGGRMCLVSVIHDVTEAKRAAARELAARQEFTRRLIASQEAERRRIAGELHDSLGQDLLLIKNRAALALNDPAVLPEHRSPLENIQDMASLAIAEVRRISHDLRPYQLDHLGLTRALEAMIGGAARNTGFPFERKFDQVDDIFPGESATHLYRAVQESVNNILKHSRATQARIDLQRDVHEVRLTISDNGRGFEASPAAAAGNTAGFGLRNIAERVRILGGRLEVNSGRGSGTGVVIVIPFSAEPV